MIKIASLFSGIGGFEKGILQAMPNANIVFSSEIDKYARQIYKKNYGVEPHGDITKIKASNIPRHDILCGGFPCQAFSIAGKRRGFEDTRGTLFFEIMRIAKVKRPKLLFLENVRGLLSHDQGLTFQTILRSMDDLGYDAEWQVFNSKNHGVPQNRERVFLVGHLRGSGTRPIFPITNSNESISKKRDGDNISTGCISTRNQSGQAQWDGSTTLIANAIDANYYKEIDNHGQRTAIVCHSTLPRNSTSGQGGTGHLQRDDELSYCCDANNNIAVEVNQQIRRLTPIECERLQGFPDNWTEGISDTQRYKCLGNAVTVNVIEFIGLHINEMLQHTDAYE